MPPLKEYIFQHKHNNNVQVRILAYNDAEAEQILFALVTKQYFNFTSITSH